jgi:hypothetical protein
MGRERKGDGCGCDIDIIHESITDQQQINQFRGSGDHQKKKEAAVTSWG